MDTPLPDPPAVADLRRVGIRPEETVPEAATGVLLWRVHRTTGEHVVPWNTHRFYGPLLRFDHHPPPVATHPDHGVWYGAYDAVTALAEAFQRHRLIDRATGAPRLTAVQMAPRLLDLTGDQGSWPTRAGGNFAINTAAHAVTQVWAHRISHAFPQIDGMRYHSRWGERPAVVLWSGPESGRARFPALPAHSWALADPRLHGRLSAAAARLGYALV